MAVAGVLLAAGGGRRYGLPKALVERDGRLLVDAAVDTLRHGGCDPVVVVLGAAADEVRARAGLAGVVVAVNPQWAEGMGTSLRVGLTAAADLTRADLTGANSARADGGVDAVVVLLVDTPGITAAAVRRVAGHAAPGALVVATYRGERGHPVLLGRDHWAGAAAAAHGDVGARGYLRAHHAGVTLVACEDIADGTDVDRPG